MIDNFKIERRKSPQTVLERLVKIAYLDKIQTKKGIEYNNKDTKNFCGGLYVQITTDDKIIISGSLHKYKNYLCKNKLTNFDAFTMNEAQETIKTLFTNLELDIEGFCVLHFEIGISFFFGNDLKELINEVLSIGNEYLNPKAFYLSPIVKDDRMKLTRSHRDLKKVFKIYDKHNEMKDKRISNSHEAFGVLRIETIYRRQEKKELSQFIELSNLEALQDQFFKEWDQLNFYSDLQAPTGTHKIKIEIAKDLIYNGTIEVLEKFKKEFENGTITRRVYYNIKEFVENWHNVKQQFIRIQKKIVKKYVELYLLEKQYYMKI
ncbi:hypothetical protein P3875_01260 [Myroides sp. JBRI-B21084]|uniref:hypothetical protein n=1 Tax=Myroides sp. JBRI-B21084 TaxID=3119977 RepID=UPI0026E239C7|nr:hypothetical protein [Paenimyroides cloacae]WKW46729.1 hypothetical protein P3875_01260 [Paenimyroides cloacae]